MQFSYYVTELHINLIKNIFYHNGIKSGWKTVFLLIHNLTQVRSQKGEEVHRVVPHPTGPKGPHVGTPSFRT